MTIKNNTSRRLNVIIPPGHGRRPARSPSPVAARGGRGGGLQSIGLGSVTNREGAFGEFQGEAVAGLRSVPPTDDAAQPRPWPSPPARRSRSLSPASASITGSPAPTRSRQTDPHGR